MSARDLKANKVDAAINLIDKGLQSIQKDKDHPSVVLVVGNTGAGKSTLTKLLTSPEDLESHQAPDRFLVYDSLRKISRGEDTLVSQTLVPELMVGKEGPAFYDLPGFMDSRDESTELANAFLMKKVAEKAKNVKILFVINHSSLLSGQNRIDCKEFLENSTALIRNTKKFAPAMALVATKVSSDDIPQDRIIPGIVAFLQTVKDDLHRVFQDHLKCKAAEDIVNALLTQDPSGTYTRIAYFSEPRELGPLAKIDTVMEERAEILPWSDIFPRTIIPTDIIPPISAMGDNPAKGGDNPAEPFIWSKNALHQLHPVSIETGT